MHFTGTTAFMLVGGMAFAGLSYVADIVVPPVGIEVHGLAYAGGSEPSIIQTRTVTARHQLTAGFKTKVSRVTATGLSEVCKGGGYWDYTAGHAAANILFDDWVGQVGCYASLETGVTYIACAEWRWGDAERAASCTIGFRKEVTK